jgi:hypothetical protein
VDNVDVEKGIITFSKLFTAKTTTFDWTQEVAENIQFSFDPDQMSFTSLPSFIYEVKNHRLFNINDVLTVGDYICPDIFHICEYDLHDVKNLILVKIKEVTVGLQDTQVHFDTCIKIGQGYRFLGISEPRIDPWTRQARIKYIITRNSLQFRATDYDLTEFKNVLDFMVKGEVL